MASHYFSHWQNRIPLWLFKPLINLWFPYLGACIKVQAISADYRHIKVIMKQRWYNTNFVGSHYGGSIYSMSDAFYMLMLIKNLGEDYIVWDKAASITFKKPGHGMLYANFHFSEAEIQSIRQMADANDKYIFDRPVDIFNQQNEVVASVVKTLFVQRKEKKL